MGAEAASGAVRRGLVLGCGGTVGGAWTVGALVAVQEALGWDPRAADVLVGTSSGSSLVALLGAGVGVDELLAAQLGASSARSAIREFFTSPPPGRPPLPRPGLASPRLALQGLRRRAYLEVASGLAPGGRGDTGFLDALIDDVVPHGGWAGHPATWITAVDLGTAKRVAFGAPGAPAAALRDAVRASWAIPAWYPPVGISGRRYVDGGVLSPTSADLLVPLHLDEVVLIAPMASLELGRPAAVGQRIERLARTPMSRIVDTEVAALRAAGTRVLRLHPTPADLAVMGVNFMDGRRRSAALESSLRTSRASVHRIADKEGAWR